MFSKRNIEMKKYGVSYTIKSDADHSNAITIGQDRVKIHWCNDLPQFKSSFGSRKVISATEKSRIVTIERIDNPPTFSDVLSWCQDNQFLEESKVQNDNNEDANSDVTENDSFNKTCVIRIRQNSDDSLGSEISMSPPTSPPTASLDKNDASDDDSDEDLINTSLDPEYESTPKVNPRLRYLSKLQQRRRRDPMLISGQTQSTSNSLAQQTLQGVSQASEFSYVTIMSIEVFVKTRGKLFPDPEMDSISAIFYAISQDSPGKPTSHGLLVLDDQMIKGQRNLLEKSGCKFKGEICIEQSEPDLIDSFVNVLQKHGPDVIVGYDTQRASLGWICRRAIHLNIELPTKISRVPDRPKDSRFGGPNGASDIDSELNIAGRILLNLWRLMRSELTLTHYSFENVIFSLFKKRVPKFTHETLTGLWRSNHTRWMVVEYFTTRSVGNLKILDKLDLIGRTTELAKLFGIQFLEVLTRGSQFRVESIMLRLAKAKNFVPVSPSVEQRAKMKAPEYLPLVMEPESRMYNDPVIVLDFQSLYPSIIMAYNYCYSTCIGRVVDHMKNGDPDEEYEMGCLNLSMTPDELAALEGKLNFSPGGIAFLKEEVRKGILPKMLQEILDTRIMVKNSMKLHGKEDARLQKILHSRQLGLKLIANVTYGYTSANFSGRMPCIEVGDSVVSKGRETLERCIKMIESTDENGKLRWPGAKVVYGDTDSVFVLLSGASKDEAFDIGEEMAKAVTQDNPKPVKLKFEKVYLPCILQTKKRYVGYMYETRDQVKPVYDAKGIETVRRDGIPATVKMLEKCLRILFETKNVTLVKQYVQNQLRKISSERVSLQELTFAKEFRGLHGYRPGACVPALELTRRFCKFDRMRVPNVGERVPYVIVYGEPGKPLIQSVRAPEEIMAEKWAGKGQVLAQRINTTYYITKVIVPALSRCLSLIGADVLGWYQDMIKVKPIPRLVSNLQDQDTGVKSKGVIPHYFVARQCPICLQRIQTAGINQKSPLCSECKNNPHKVATKLCHWIQIWDQRLQYHDQVCRECDPGYDLCRNLDCPRMYLRTEAKFDAMQINAAEELLSQF